LEAIIAQFNPLSLDEIYQKAPTVRLGGNKDSVLSFKIISEDTVIFKGLEPAKSIEFITLMEKTQAHLASRNNSSSSSSSSFSNDPIPNLGNVAFDYLHKEADVSQLALNDTVPIRPTWYSDFRSSLSYTHAFAKTDPRNLNRNNSNSSSSMQRPLADMYSLVYKTTNKEPVLLLDLHARKTRQNIGRLFSSKWRAILNVHWENTFRQAQLVNYKKIIPKTSVHEKAEAFFKNAQKDRLSGLAYALENDSGFNYDKWAAKRRDPNNNTGTISMAALVSSPDAMNICTENLEKFDVFFRHLLLLCYGCGGNPITQLYSGIYLQLFTQHTFGINVISGEFAGGMLAIATFNNCVKFLFKQVLIEQKLAKESRFKPKSSINDHTPVALDILFTVNKVEYWTKPKNGVPAEKKTFLNKTELYKRILFLQEIEPTHTFIHAFALLVLGGPLDTIDFDRFTMDGLDIKILVPPFNNPTGAAVVYDERGAHLFSESKLASIDGVADNDPGSSSESVLFNNKTSITTESYISKKEADSKVFFRNSEFILDRKVIQYLCTFFSMVAILEDTSYTLRLNTKTYITKGYISSTLYEVSRYKPRIPRALFGPEIALCWAPATIDLIGVLKMNMDNTSDNYAGDVFLQNMYENVIKKYMEVHGIKLEKDDAGKFMEEYKRFIGQSNAPINEYLMRARQNQLLNINPIPQPQPKPPVIARPRVVINLEDDVDNDAAIAIAIAQEDDIAIAKAQDSLDKTLNILKRNLQENVKEAKKRKRSDSSDDSDEYQPPNDYDYDDDEDEENPTKKQKPDKKRKKPNPSTSDEDEPLEKNKKKNPKKVIDLSNENEGDDKPTPRTPPPTVGKKIYNTKSCDQIIGYKYPCNGCNSSFPKFKTSTGIYVCSRLCL
jgi:hypothetical protein